MSDYYKRAQDEFWFCLWIQERRPMAAVPGSTDLWPLWEQEREAFLKAHLTFGSPEAVADAEREMQYYEDVKAAAIKAGKQFEVTRAQRMIDFWEIRRDVLAKAIEVPA